MAVGPATELSIIVKFLGEGLASLTLATDGLKKLLDLGIDYNKENETAQVGITGLVASLTQLTDAEGHVLQGQEAFNAAAGIASDQLQKLQKDSLLTTATFPQLRDAFQAALAPGVEAGLTLDQIRTLTKDIALAAGAIGLPMEQVAQETRAILEGNIDINARLAQSLGITNQMVNDWKAQGTLAAELNKRLEQFARMGDAVSKTWAGISSNMEEVFQKFSGLATQDLFANLKKSLAEALEGTIDTSTGKLDKDLEAIASRFNDALGVVGQDVGSVIVFIVDKVKEFGHYLEQNKATVDQMTGSFNQVWEAVKEVIKALADIPSLDGTNSAVELLGEGFGIAAQVVASVADGIKAVDMTLKYVGASANEFLGTMYDAYAAVDRFTGNLKNAAIDQEIAERFHQSAESMKKDADEIWTRFANGESSLAKINSQLERLGQKGKEATQSTKEGLEKVSQAFDGFYQNTAQAAIGFVDLNKEAQTTSTTLETLFKDGKISQKTYQEGIDRINERLKQLGSEATVTAKPLEEINKSLASVNKKPIEDTSQAFTELGVTLTKLNPSQQLEAWNKVYQEFEKGNVTLELTQKAFLSYAESLVKSRLEAGEDVGVTIKQEAAKLGLSEALNKIIRDYHNVNPALDAYIERSSRKMESDQTEATIVQNKIEIEKSEIETQTKLAKLKGDSVTVAELTVKAAQKEVDAVALKVKQQESLVKTLQEELIETERLADLDGQRSVSETKTIDNLRERVSEESKKLEISKNSLQVAQLELTSIENLNGKTQAYLSILRQLNQYELELDQTRQTVRSNMERVAELNLELAQSSGDVLQIDQAQSELDAAQEASNQAQLDVLRSKVQVAQDEYDQTLLQVTADGNLTLEESKLLNVKQAAIGVAESNLSTTSQMIDKTKELAEAKKKEAEETKKAAEAEREHAAQLKAQGDFVSAILSGWQKRLTDLSEASFNAFLKMRGATEGYLNSTENVADKISNIDKRIVQIYRDLDYGFVRWANTVAIQALTVEKSFWSQVESADALINKLKEADSSTGKSVVNLGSLIRQAESTKQTLNLLDQTRLDNLQAQIDAAKSKMQELRDAAQEALDTAQRALLQEQGDDKALLRLDYEQKKLELQKKINTARHEGDQETLSNLQQALSLEEQVYNLKLKKLNTSSESNTSTTSTTGSGSGTTVNYNINADVSSLVTEDFWRKKVLPITSRVNKLSN